MSHFGDNAPVGEGLSELRVFYTHGYRVSFVQTGSEVILLLSGGDKSSQQTAIARAKEMAKQVKVQVMGIKTTRWDSAEYLKTDEDIQLYLEACIEEAGDDPAFIVHALGGIARAKNMSQLARDTGLTREGLYKAFSPEGNPSFTTVAKVAKAMGLQITVQTSNKGPSTHRLPSASPVDA